jgi:hypothetical protein
MTWRTATCDFPLDVRMRGDGCSSTGEVQLVADQDVTQFYESLGYGRLGWKHALDGGARDQRPSDVLCCRRDLIGAAVRPTAPYPWHGVTPRP